MTTTWLAAAALLSAMPRPQAVETILPGCRIPLTAKPDFRLALVGVEFADAPHNPAFKPADWERAFFSIGEYRDRAPGGAPVYGSVADFWRSQGGGVKVAGKFVGWVKLSAERGTYDGPFASGRCLMSAHALAAVEDQIGGKALAGFDAVFLIYAGPRGKSRSGGLWPHASVSPHQGRVMPYAVMAEGGRDFPDTSTAVHEFGHLLGLPDEYGPGRNTGPWCTMALGHVGPGTTPGRPFGACAVCKARLGVLKPRSAEAGDVVLPPVSKSDGALQLPLPDGGRLVLENRDEPGLPGAGLLVWRVGTDGLANLLPANGSASGDAVFRAGVPFPYGGRDSLAVGPWRISGIQRRDNGEVSLRIAAAR